MTEDLHPDGQAPRRNAEGQQQTARAASEHEPDWGIPVGSDPASFANEAEVWRPPPWAADGYNESLQQAQRHGAGRTHIAAGGRLDNHGAEWDEYGRQLPAA